MERFAAFFVAGGKLIAGCLHLIDISASAGTWYQERLPCCFELSKWLVKAGSEQA